MVKPRRKFSFSDTCPQFFKVYLPNQSSHKLRIPPAFVSHFNGVIPSKSTLRSRGRRSWKVEVNKVDNNLYFQNGWDEFARDNSLEFGDFLVFCYDDSSVFYVKIFGKSGCLKEVPIPTRKGTQKPPTVLQENQTLETRKNKQLLLKDSGKQITKRTSQPHSRGLKAASEFVSAHPFFQVFMKPTHAKYGSLSIPLRFVTSYMEKGKESAILQVSDKSWPVKVKTYTNGLARFSKGWAAFAKENTLKVGDVIVFELIERNVFVLKVSFLRG